MRAKQSILGLVYTGGEVRRPPLIGMQFLHERAVRPADLVAPRPRLQAKDLIPVQMAGKPFAPIYDMALAEAQILLGRPVDRRRVLCVGDGIGTDVKGASDQKLDCLFIARGSTATPPSAITASWTPT